MSLMSAVVTPDEFGEMHGIPPRDVLKIIAARQVPVLRFNKRTIRIPRAAAEQWMPGTPDQHPVMVDVLDVEDIYHNDEIVDVVREYVTRLGRHALLDALSAPPHRRRSIPPRIRTAVLVRDGRICQYCMKPIGPRTRFHIDHVIPHSAGGSSIDINNLVISCVRCNTRKGTNHGYRCRGCQSLMWDDYVPHRCPIATTPA